MKVPCQVVSGERRGRRLAAGGVGACDGVPAASFAPIGGVGGLRGGAGHRGGRGPGLTTPLFFFHKESLSTPYTV